MKILVVDDDDISRTVIKKVLASDFHEVILASDGQEAIQVLRDQDIQLVISDWNMPGIDGIQLCKSLRANSSLGYIYIIIITGRHSKEDLLTGLAAGADDLITKPFEPTELLLRIRNAERILSLETTALTLFSMAKLAESKDTDTGNHLERIRAYTRVLAEEITHDPSFTNENLSSRFPKLMYDTSPLHDIGKVGIPDYVLLKPGSLSDQEWDIMKRHAQIGGETLDAVLKKFPNAEFLRIARDIAWFHHERWDGSGYPRGLKGEEIPLCARIIALADVYDALTMKRVYKSALSHEVARGIITEGSGKHFDPRVVQAFLRIEQEFVAIRESYSDTI
jgi:putative two-component system response regulator